MAGRSMIVAGIVLMVLGAVVSLATGMWWLALILFVSAALCLGGFFASLR